MAYTDRRNAPIAAGNIVRRNFFKAPAAAGDENMNVDGSATPVHFDLMPTQGKSLAVSVIAIDLRGDNMASNKFGDIAVLTNGVLIHLLDDQDALVGAMFQEPAYPMGKPIKSNADLIEWFDGEPVRDSGLGGDDILAVMTRFSDDLTGGPMLVPADHKLRVIVRDNLSALTAMTMHVRGYEFE